MLNIKDQINSWIATEAQSTINNYYTKSFPSLDVPELTVKFGQKYAKVWTGNSIWAFIALTDEVTKAQRVGDLLKPASLRAPAKHSRGNILNGTAAYGPYGPEYLK
jgi:glutamine cyclotransferase